ncbi:uncharacterized protein At4g04775-like [Mercurialis annua]|uniref:uncharacterized protein At4g04775-like n=1 Tax=Mercurialis annua TaxID=3986 RepID=UPI00215DDEFC|nr:uncharacterized protein At4g04775-like [Mercurialis annua]
MSSSNSSSRCTSIRNPQRNYPFVEDYDEFIEVYCSCGELVRRRISWTDDNPGRRFYGCARYSKKQMRKCTNFRWYDVDFPERAKQVIRDFMKEVDKLNSENDLLREKEDEFGSSRLRRLEMELVQLKNMLQQQKKSSVKIPFLVLMFTFIILVAIYYVCQI